MKTPRANSPGFLALLFGMMLIPVVCDVVLFSPASFVVMILQYAYAIACGLFLGLGWRRP